MSIDSHNFVSESWIYRSITTEILIHINIFNNSQRPPSSSLSYGGAMNDDVRSPGSGSTPGPLSAQPPPGLGEDPGEFYSTLKALFFKIFTFNSILFDSIIDNKKGTSHAIKWFICDEKCYNYYRMRLIRDLTQIIVRWYEKSAPQKFKSWFMTLLLFISSPFCWFCSVFVTLLLVLLLVLASTWEFLMIKSKTKAWKRNKESKINLNFFDSTLIAAVTTIQGH